MPSSLPGPLMLMLVAFAGTWFRFLTTRKGYPAVLWEKSAKERNEKWLNIFRPFLKNITLFLDPLKKLISLTSLIFVKMEKNSAKNVINYFIFKSVEYKVVSDPTLAKKSWSATLVKKEKERVAIEPHVVLMTLGSNPWTCTLSKRRYSWIDVKQKTVKNNFAFRFWRTSCRQRRSRTSYRTYS